MTTVPGTYFTKEQLEATLTVDNISARVYSGSNRMENFGWVYENVKKQYDKALAWFILAAMEDNPTAQNNIGTLYFDGHGVPKNYLCALKWYLESAEGNDNPNTFNNIGDLFEYGRDVPLDKYRALEWYCHGGYEVSIDQLESQGYQLSATDTNKPLYQLRKETKTILDAEKKKLEEKQYKTQQEMETLVDLNITYKLTGGGQNTWNDVPILSATSKERYTESMNNSATNKDQEILELKQQIQTNDSKIASLQREKQAMEQNKTNTTNEMERLKALNSTLEQLLKTKDEVIMSLNRENQMLSTANQGHQQGANEMVDTLKSLLEAKTSETKLLKQNMDKEKGKNKKLKKEIMRLKQQQQQTVDSREARPSISTTLPEPTTSSSATLPEPTASSNTTLPEPTASSNNTVHEATASNNSTNGDDPNNDFNYDTECGTEYSSSDDTSSEGGNNANDLNYDSDD